MQTVSNEIIRLHEVLISESIATKGYWLATVGFIEEPPAETRQLQRWEEPENGGHDGVHQEVGSR